MKIHHTKAHGESITGHDIDCDICGSTFSKTPCLIERDANHYCSKSCRLRGQSRSRSEIIEVIQNLASKLSRTPRRHDIRGETGIDLDTITRHFDSWNNALRAGGFEINEKWKKEKHERKYRYYGPNWEKQAKKARERDGYKCVRCGYSNERSIKERGRSLPVHHIEWDESNDYKQRNRLSNLMTLCHSCHRKIEALPLIPQFSSD
jgi:5-methylcytosine-specific restriction endonuclease McrA